ncbi:hypothetical protein FIBSPDRAFT_283764 [Athelia psychrophila]|uniref:Uncharacterized protein n=1 Tax=Athelia psychrophila TaxID=1759441 RepID=A0A166R4Q2_9AGAM|nr:hypothetical protein FIBSPDRAFT_283764 [Fibularhizoctonia sp. CBS 109695]
MPSSLSSGLLYTAAAVSALTVLGHTKMGYDEVFPSLKNLAAAGDIGAGAAKIGWMEVNQGFFVMAVLCAKWAKYGVRGPYDKALLGMFASTQLWAGWSYLQLGITEPLVPLWGIPALVGLSQLV